MLLALRAGPASAQSASTLEVQDSLVTTVEVSLLLTLVVESFSSSNMQLNLTQAAALASQVDIANLTITNIYFYTFLNRSIHNLAEDVKLQAEASKALSLDILRSAQTLPAVLVDFKIRTAGPSVVSPSISAINNQLALFDLPPAPCIHCIVLIFFQKTSESWGQLQRDKGIQERVISKIRVD